MKKKLEIKNIYCYFLVLLPILDQYLIGGVPFETIFAVFGLIIIIGYRGLFFDYNHLYSGIIIWILYTLIILLIHSPYSETSIARLLLRIGLFVLMTINICIISTNVCTYEKMFDIYSKVVVLLSIIILMQTVVYAVLGKCTMLLIPGLDLNYSEYSSSEYMTNTLVRFTQGWYYRPCSLFMEPAHHAQYTMPWLFVTLMGSNINDSKKIKVAMFVSMAIVLTGSSLGVVGVVIAWFMGFCRWTYKTNRSSIITNSILLIIVIIAMVILFKIPSVQFYFNMKMKEMTATNLGSNSFTVRILRGYACFGKFNLFEILFGCGYGNILSYINLNHISTIFDGQMTDLSYMNGLSTLLCSSGIVGSVFYIYIFFIKGIIKTSRHLGLLIALFIIMTTSADFNTPLYYLFFSMILLEKCHTYPEA